MRHILGLLILLTINAAYATPTVAVSIKPIHDLVSIVMNGAGEPTLIIPVGSDPHDYALAPSQSVALEKADLIIWVGPDLEIALIKPMLNYTQKSIMLIDNPHLIRYELRNANNWNKDKDPGSLIEGSGPHIHIDPHVWLEPNNAIVILQQVANELSTRDPEHKTLYHRNVAAAVKRITALETHVMNTLKPIQKSPYLVYHDAYQYFEQAFDTTDLGSITVHPDMPPTAARLAEINEILKKHPARCIFTEPQVNQGVVQGIATQYGLKIGILDPMGKASMTGVAAYESLLDTMAANMKECLE